MRTVLYVATLCATVVGQQALSIREAAAQQAPPTDVAIVDLAYIFKSHPRLQAMSNELRREAETADAQLKADTETIRGLAMQLETFQKGSAEYKKLEEDIATRQANLQLQKAMKQKDFLERDVQNHYGVYQEVINHVRYYSESAGIKLVLQFNGDFVGEQIDRNDPEDVRRGLNNSVVYYNRAIDITPVILERLIANAVPQPQAAVPQRSPVGVPARQ